MPNFHLRFVSSVISVLVLPTLASPSSAVLLRFLIYVIYLPTGRSVLNQGRSSVHSRPRAKVFFYTRPVNYIFPP